MSTTRRLALICTVAALPLLRAQPHQVDLALVDREGHKTVLGSPPSNTFAPRISPDGKQVAYDAGGAIWIAGITDLSAARRLAEGNFPMWSPDGTQIVHAVGRNAEQMLVVERADGTGQPQMLVPGRSPESWSARDQLMSFITLTDHYNIWTYSFRDRKAASLIDMPAVNQHSSSLSPDGKWIAYVSDESGRFEAFVAPFPVTPGRGQGRFRISTEGGRHPIWSPDGREICFDNNGQLFSVSVRTEANFSAGPPVALPISGFVQGAARRQFDITPDGRQFLMLFRR